jgi:Gpi18-like mannosyltransferase
MKILKQSCSLIKGCHLMCIIFIMTLALNLQIMLRDDKWNKLGECFKTQTHFHKCAKMKHNIFKWIPILEVGVSRCLNFWNKL